MNNIEYWLVITITDRKYDNTGSILKAIKYDVHDKHMLDFIIIF